MKYDFKAVEARDKVIEWIRAEADRAQFKKVVLGISGGKDSTIAAALCCRALGNENVHGILLPNGLQKDLADAFKVCAVLDIEHDTINIKPVYDAFVMQYMMFVEDHTKDKANKSETVEEFIETYEEPKVEQPSDEALINLGPRIRMAFLRLWGQTHHHRLCGTGNFSEITVGYCTKDGDTSCDFNPLGRLTSVEVVEIGKTMDEIPLDLVTKTPADGLSGVPDEKKLGVSYLDIHNYIRAIEMNSKVWDKIYAMELAGIHKRTTTPMFIPEDNLLYTVD